MPGTDVPVPEDKIGLHFWAVPRIKRMKPRLFLIQDSVALAMPSNDNWQKTDGFVSFPRTLEQSETPRATSGIRSWITDSIFL